MKLQGHSKQTGLTLAEALIAIGAPEVLVLAAAREFYRERRLGQYLIEHGVITERQLYLALAHQAEQRGDLVAARSYLAHVGEVIDNSIDTKITSIQAIVAALGSKA